MNFLAYFVTFRKRCCLKKRAKPTTNQPVIEEDGYAVYTTNSEDQSHVQLAVSTQTQLAKPDRIAHTYATNIGDACATNIPEDFAEIGERADGSVSVERPRHIEHTYFVTSDMQSKWNSGSMYATIPEKSTGMEEGEGKTRDDYTYAYGHIPNRGTIKK